MRKFLALLMLSIVLIAIWFVTAVMLPVHPDAYLDLSAPWWHMLLHVGWAASLSVTVFSGIYLAWELRLRQRHKLTRQPPDQANRR